jgi:hypothetical protein
VSVYTSLQDVSSAYTSALEQEDDGLFAQGAVIAAAVDAGFVRKDVLTHCAQLGGQSVRTTRNRERVWRVFGEPGRRAQHIRWSLHDLCCTGVNIDDKSTYADARKWLEIAEAGYTDETGQWRPHSYATLKAQIVASGGDPDSDKPVYLLDNVEAELFYFYPGSGLGHGVIELRFTSALPNSFLENVKPDHKITVTLVQVPALEAA